MNFKYMIDLEESNIYNSTDRSIYNMTQYAQHYKKNVYFMPSESEKSRAPYLYNIGYEIQVPGKSIINRVWFTYWVIHFVVGGKGTFNGTPVSKGMCFIGWNGIPHSFVSSEDEPLEYYWYIIRNKSAVKLVSASGYEPGNLVFKCPYLSEVVHLLDFAMNTDLSKTDVFEFSNSMMRMLLSYPKKSVASDMETVVRSPYYIEYVDTAKRLLRESNYTLSIAELSAKLGITSRHFCRVFFSVTGEHPKKYILNKKMDFAVELMKSGISPTEASQMVGYSEYASFYRAFLATYGFSPKQCFMIK